jgi:hypothetical protein
VKRVFFGEKKCSVWCGIYYGKNTTASTVNMMDISFEFTKKITMTLDYIMTVERLFDTLSAAKNGYKERNI